MKNSSAMIFNISPRVIACNPEEIGKFLCFFKYSISENRFNLAEGNIFRGKLPNFIKKASLKDTLQSRIFSICLSLSGLINTLEKIEIAIAKARKLVFTFLISAVNSTRSILEKRKTKIVNITAGAMRFLKSLLFIKYLP